MTINLTDIVVPTLTFGKVEKGQVFLYQDGYYLKIRERSAIRIGVTSDYAFDADETIWFETDFGPELFVKKIYPKVSIIFD